MGAIRHILHREAPVTRKGERCLGQRRPQLGGERRRRSRRTYDNVRRTGGGTCRPRLSSGTSRPDRTTLTVHMRLRRETRRRSGTGFEQLRGQLLQWGTPDLMVFVTTNDGTLLVDPGARVGPRKDEYQHERVLTVVCLFGEASIPPQRRPGLPISNVAGRFPLFLTKNM